MPNYYIQAKRGTFNPFSFDEYVKPLNMYKEYYEKNEEAITDMQEQANLWKNIMESEKDSKLAEKYNTYVNNLNNATQQLKNGMSYNLRNQIQQLRGQSAMVKQIENAYNLRAKDIDTYNELMLKDPSRIGAYDPSQRKLQEYLNGPVTNEYGVSGDRLYALGNARAKAMSAQKDRYGNAISTLGDQYFMLKHTKGYSDKEITEMLKNQSPELFNEIDRIIQQEGTQLNNYDDLNTAETYILNGMLSGFTYDEDRKYMKNENYMNDYDYAKAMLDLGKKKYERDILGLKYDMMVSQALGLGINPNQLTDSYTRDDVKIFKPVLPDDAEKPINNTLKSFKEHTKTHFYDLDGNGTTKNIEDIKNIANKSEVNFNDFKNDIEYYIENKNVQPYLTQYVQGAPGAAKLHPNPEYTPIREKLNAIEEKYKNKGFKIGDIEDSYSKYLRDKNEIDYLNNIVDNYGIPGITQKEKFDNLDKYLTEASELKNYGGYAYDNQTELDKILANIRGVLNTDTTLELDKIEKDGEKSRIEHKDVASIINKKIYPYPSNQGFAFADENGDFYIVAKSSNDDINNYNRDVYGINQFLINPFALIDAEKSTNGGEIPKEFDKSRLRIIPNTNIEYTIYEKNNDLYARIVNRTTNGSRELKLFDVNSWQRVSEELISAEANRMKAKAIGGKSQNLNGQSFEGLDLTD